MNEYLFDSSNRPYYEINDPDYNFKQVHWDMAIGLQMVDDLKPSKYLEKLSEDNINGKITIKEVEYKLKEYYVEKKSEDSIIKKELECDFVSMRIVELLEKNNFELSVDYLKYVHQYLFQDVYDFAGVFRNVNFSKPEIILNNDSVAYGDFNTLEESLGYDISLEKEKDYSNMNSVLVIQSIANFSSRLWQVHPFREGNTRTTAVFIQKYLMSLGYFVSNDLFKEKSIYFRNALVRSNYFNDELDIKEDITFLIKFYENLLLKKNNQLRSRELIVKELFEV